MSALSDLKQVVFTGYLEKKVDLTLGDPEKTFTFTLRTLTLPEEIKVFEACNLEGPPENQKDFFMYILATLKYAVKEVNGEAADPQELSEVLATMDPVKLGVIWTAWKELDTKLAEAGPELKNS